MKDIIKYSIKEPDANIMILENSYINNNIITIDKESSHKIFLPTMYESWNYRQVPHIKFNIIENTENTELDISNNDILYIFDTWGLSSYYHLLIDHIIPLWITKNFIEEFLLEKNKSLDIGKSFFYRVSNNNYNNELSSTKEIFRHFFKDNYIDTISGGYKYIVYGYCYTYRPYHGPNFLHKYYPNYQYIFDKFIHRFTENSNSILKNDKYIIIPERTTRNYDGIDYIYNNLRKIYNVKKIDFGNFSIKEQIEISSGAWAIIGCEGAAFANQIFMSKGSLIITIINKSSNGVGGGGGVEFQSSISEYMKHEFHNIIVNNLMNRDILSQNILNICNNYYNR